MLRKKYISLLFTLVFVLFAVFGNGQAWAQCGALVPSIQYIPIAEKWIKVTVDPCTGQFMDVVFCDDDGLGNPVETTCSASEWKEGLWCIDKNRDGVSDPSECRSWEVVLDAAAHRGAYSNCNYFYWVTYRICR